jgi:hypothetical protein
MYHPCAPAVGTLIGIMMMKINVVLYNSAPLAMETGIYARYITLLIGCVSTRGVRGCVPKDVFAMNQSRQ